MHSLYTRDKAKTIKPYKLICIGDSGCGKSCLVKAFTEKKFLTSHDLTIGIEFDRANIELAGKIIQLQIWDTAGQESFRSITQSYYHDSAAAIIVFDLTSQSSFKNVGGWLADIKNYADPNIQITLVGNKSDLSSKRIIDRDTACKFATMHALPYIETSAKSFCNVTALFRQIAESVYLHQAQIRSVNPDELIELHEHRIRRKKGTCCTILKLHTILT